MVVTSSPIRIQLPGGALYAPALAEAASKTGARSGLPTKTIKAFNELVVLAVNALNSGAASMITLEMQVHESTLEARLIGKGCTSPTKKLLTQLDSTAAKKAKSFATKKTKSALTITFEA